MTAFFKKYGREMIFIFIMGGIVSIAILLLLGEPPKEVFIKYMACNAIYMIVLLKDWHKENKKK
ncbi:MAG: hypothetical protein ACRC6X_06515 [Culicoidibacterales bacterium]